MASVFWDAYIFQTFSDRFAGGFVWAQSTPKSWSSLSSHHFFQRKRPYNFGYPPCVDKNQSLSSFFLILKKSEIWVFSIFGRRSWFGPSNWSFLGTEKDPMRRTRRASAAPHSQGPQFFWASVALGEQSLALATKIWVNYNDLTATSLRGIIPIWP